MCGIFGIYNLKKKTFINEIKFGTCLKVMLHRGPNDQSFERITDNLIFGHVRLSIIDLSEGSNQPFKVDMEKFWIVYNGEIYNYIELKDELVKLGYQFNTSSDTEVLINSYIEWGEECVHRFNGMWAFSIYDKEKEKLFCSRDRFGVKPFNYAQVDGQFIFASEIKAILDYFPELKVPNYNVIANYCRTSIGAQIKETWFDNIYRLEPAHNLIIDSHGLKIVRYWDYPNQIDKSISFDQAKETFKELFINAVELRMRSDVPVGFTLSSGIDSSSIVSVLRGKLNKNTNTYTAAFTKNSFSNSEKQNFKKNVEIDEPKIVRKLAKEIKLDPTIFEIDFSDYTTKLSKIIYHMESGHGSPAIYPLNAILEVASKDVTVLLEGQGADELLGGYISSVQPIYIIKLFKDFKWLSVIHELKSFIKVYSLKSSFMLLIRNSNILWFQKIYYRILGIDNFYLGKIKHYKQIKDYPNNNIRFDDFVNSYLHKIHTGGLVNLLHYGDAISMAHSLESRLPFMDYRLVEYAFKLPSEYKVKNGLGKFIHRQAMKGIVPDFILSNPVKFGFDSPLSHIFSMTDPNSASSILLSETCLDRGLFSEKAIRKTLKKQIEGNDNYSRFLYRMLSVELWFREFID
jgi:asparagine synthase (glutamine-hydrolysing)